MTGGNNLTRGEKKKIYKGNLYTRKCMNRFIILRVVAYYNMAGPLSQS